MNPYLGRSFHLNFKLADKLDRSQSVKKKKSLNEGSVNRSADKSLARPEGNKLMFLSEWREFPSAPCLAGKET
jgi:hypothetical protein